jgi:hypothetical protein
VNECVGRTVGGGGSSGFVVELYDGKEMRFRVAHAMLLCVDKVVTKQLKFYAGRQVGAEGLKSGCAGGV